MKPDLSKVRAAVAKYGKREVFKPATPYAKKPPADAARRTVMSQLGKSCSGFSHPNFNNTH